MNEAMKANMSDPAAGAPASTVVAAARRPRRNRTDIALLFAAMVAIGGVAFAGGRATAQSAAVAQDCGPGGGGGGGGAPGAPEAPGAPGGAGQ